MRRASTATSVSSSAALGAFYNTDVEVPATLTVDGRVFRDVGVRFRGNSSFFAVPAGRKRPLNVSLDFVHENQELGGYRTFNLLNAAQDPTFLRSVLYNHIAREYLPAPKANFVRVVINGESWGVYPSVQQFNKDFARDWYGTPDGARWKAPPQGRGGLQYLGDDPAVYKRAYEIKSKDDPAAWTSLVTLARVLDTTPPDRLEAALAPILDVDETLRFLAVDVALVNGDGYWTRGSDFSLFRDPKGRFHITTHDANETFSGSGGGGPGRGGRGGPGGPGGADLDPLVGLDDATKPLRSKLLSVPALRERYLNHVRDIATKWLDWQRLGPVAGGYHALIAADVKADTKKLDTYEAFEAGLPALKSFVERRRAVLLK
jgi:spore coat protein CotH